MEVIDIVDKQLNIIRTGHRGERLKNGEFFKFIHIWIVQDDMILIQKRSYDRLWAAGKWATHTGVVGTGEEELSCAVREVSEEIGVSIDINDIELGFIIEPKNRFKGIGFVYFIKVDEIDIVIDNVEVIDYQFVSIEKLKSMIKNKQFIHYGNDGRDYSNYFTNVFIKLNELMEG